MSKCKMKMNLGMAKCICVIELFLEIKMIITPKQNTKHFSDNTLTILM